MFMLKLMRQGFAHYSNGIMQKLLLIAKFPTPSYHHVQYVLRSWGEKLQIVPFKPLFSAYRQKNNVNAKHSLNPNLLLQIHVGS